MARPRLNESDRRDINITVAFNQREYEKVSALSKRTRKRLAEYIRLSALGDSNLKIVSELNLLSAQNLRELHHLLSQLVTLLKEHQITIIDPITIIEMQKDLRQMHHDFLNYGNHENNQRQHLRQGD